MKNTVTESLISSLKRKMPTKQTTGDIDFLRTYYHRLSSQDYDAHRVLEFRDAALKHRKLGSRRKPGEIIVEIANILAPENSANNDPDKTIIYMVLDDRPFIINSLLMKLNGLRKTPLLLLHPLFEVARDKNCKAVSYEKFHPSNQIQDGNKCIESYIQVVVDYIPKKEHGALATTLRDVITEINDVVSDWHRMSKKVLGLADIVDAMKKGPVFAEYGELFSWMTQDHFAFLGY